MATTDDDVHRSSARSLNFTTASPRHGLDLANVTVSIDANQSVQATVDVDDRRWRMDLKIKRLGTSCNATVERLFRDGAGVDEDRWPLWLGAVREEIERRMEEKSR